MLDVQIWLYHFCHTKIIISEWVIKISFTLWMHYHWLYLDNNLLDSIPYIKDYVVYDVSASYWMKTTFYNRRLGRGASLLIEYAITHGKNWCCLPSVQWNPWRAMHWHSASGAQRYIFRHCSKTFQLNFSYSGSKPNTNPLLTWRWTVQDVAIPHECSASALILFCCT